MKTTIIVPTYNEAQNIEKFLTKVLDVTKNIKGFEVDVLVVDDYSPDGTADLVKALNSPRVKLISNSVRGLGNAYIFGFKHVLKELKSDVIMQMDSDFSHNPEDIPRMLEAVSQGYDYVIGSRYVHGGSIPENWGWHRKLNSFFGNLVTRYFVGVGKVKDTTAGFKAMKAEIFNKIDLDAFKVNGYSFQIWLLFCAIYDAGAKVKEVPIHFIDRELGESKLGLKDITEFLMNALKLRMKLVKRWFKTT